MNLLLSALTVIEGVMPSQKIKLVQYKNDIVNGFPVSTETELNGFANVQPLTPFEIKKLTDSTIDSRSYYRFFILNDLATVLNFLNQTETVISWSDRKFKVFSKSDWSLNGWIEVIGSEISNV